MLLKGLWKQRPFFVAPVFGVANGENAAAGRGITPKIALGKKGLAAKLGKARGIMRVAINALPIKKQERFIKDVEIMDMLIQALAHGKRNAKEPLTAAEVARLDSEYAKMLGTRGANIDEFVQRIYERVNKAISMHAIEELRKDINRLLESIEPHIDAATKKYEIGKIGAQATRYLRRKIKPALLSTESRALEKIGILRAEYDELSTSIDSGHLSADSLSNRPESVSPEANANVRMNEILRELLIWENYSCMNAAGVEKVVEIHSFVFNFIKTQQDAWNSILTKRAAKWQKTQENLLNALPLEATPQAMHNLGKEAKSYNKNVFSKYVDGLENGVHYLDRVKGKEGCEVFLGGLMTRILDANNNNMVAQYQRVPLHLPIMT